MGKTHSEDCVLMLGDQEIAFIRDVTLNNTSADVDTTTRADGYWENSETGRQSWDFTTEVLEDSDDPNHNFSTLENAKVARTVLTAVFKRSDETGVLPRAGLCQVRTFNTKEPHGGVVSADITVKSKGVLTVPAVPSS